MPSAFGAQSSNPFGEQSTFGQPQVQQQPQQQQSGNFGSGAVVPYGAPGGYGEFTHGRAPFFTVHTHAEEMIRAACMACCATSMQAQGLIS